MTPEAGLPEEEFEADTETLARSSGAEAVEAVAPVVPIRPGIEVPEVEEQSLDETHSSEGYAVSYFARQVEAAQTRCNNMERMVQEAQARFDEDKERSQSQASLASELEAIDTLRKTLGKTKDSLSLWQARLEEAVKLQQTNPRKSVEK